MNNYKIERLKIVAGVSAIAFAVTLATIVGNRLDNESLAVLAGAACGVGAAIPTSLLVVWVTRRTQNPKLESQNSHTYPPVVVVAPPGTHPQSLLPPGPQPSYPPSPRTFTIVGDDYE